MKLFQCLDLDSLRMVSRSIKSKSVICEMEICKSFAYFHFANYRFSFRFVSFRFANYSKPCYGMSSGAKNLCVLKYRSVVDNSSDETATVH